jgi:hypothetical protein
LQNLNNVVPELYQLALDSYSREGSNLLNQYNLLADREAQAYARGQAAVERQDAAKQREQAALLEKAELLAKAGDYSLLKQYYNLTDEQVAAIRPKGESVGDDPWKGYEGVAGGTLLGANDRLHNMTDGGRMDGIIQNIGTGSEKDQQGSAGTQSDRVKKFVAQHMTLEEALRRGITEKEYAAMVADWLNGVDLSDAEFAQLERELGIG